jgi:RNA polymerase sigma-70 factor (ECF subfamily)
MPDRPPDDPRSLVGRLYDMHGAALYRYALMLLADAASAEDAVQQVFAALLRRPVALENELHYLRRAVRNECYSHLRRRQKDDQIATLGPLLEPVAGSVTQEDRTVLEAAIRGLSPEQREVIHLHVFEGLTFREIAEASDTSINTVAARYRYALEQLRKVLGP